MKKFLSIKQVTTTLSKTDVELFKLALDNPEHRMNFIMVVGEVLEIHDNNTEVKALLDQMCSILYQKSIIRKTVLGKINYAETHYTSAVVVV
jgi:hypothetical protein